MNAKTTRTMTGHDLDAAVLYAGIVVRESDAGRADAPKTEELARALIYFEENIRYLLDTPETAPYLVRVREGGGPEDVVQSLVVTFMKMRNFLRAAVARAYRIGMAQGVADYAVWKNGGQYVGVLRRPLHDVVARVMEVGNDEANDAVNNGGPGGMPRNRVDRLPPVPDTTLAEMVLHFDKACVRLKAMVPAEADSWLDVVAAARRALEARPAP